MEVVTDLPFLGLQNHCVWWLQPRNQKMIASWQERDDKPRQCGEKQRHYFANKGPYNQGSGLPRGHVWLWELDHKEGKTPKSCCLRTVVQEKTPESPLEGKEIKPVDLKGDQPWIFTGRNDAKAEASVFWSSDANRRLIGKVPSAGIDWGQKEKRASKDEMEGEEGVRGWVGWTASLMQLAWTWANSRRWWGTRRLGVLQSMGFQRVGRN